MKKIVAIIAIAMTFIACNDNEQLQEKLEGKNKVVIEFDNGFNNDKILLGSSSHATSNDEVLAINSLDYIVSNFVLVAEDGTEHVYPKNKSYFIISEGGNGKTKNVQISLEDIPAGKYNKIKFGIGVDQERFKQGQAAQEGFWTLAESYNLTWSWQAGYKFVVLEGNFKEKASGADSPYMLHIASRGTSVDLYKEVELSMDVAIVGKGQSPQLHVKVDAGKILDGTTKIKLSEGATIMGGDKAKNIADNYTAMFMVHHVHNANHH
ncbi:MbnP family protein [Tenacibaculum sp. 190524A02b]|uniref:Copper-binding protein MbnP-like domain-containing protein n=1 Tax=Tenacibaculum vairaonense TaxID=3137860 RepID=A0ABM9PMY1_9FLAO